MLSHLWATMWIGPSKDQICLNRRCETGSKFPQPATVASLTHETLHLVINDLEGTDSGDSLDNIELWETMQDWVDPPEKIRWKGGARKENERRVHGVVNYERTEAQ